MEIIVENEAALPAAIDQVLEFAAGRKKFLLTGDLGAGKTTFTQHFCRRIGVADRVTSPTFALVNEYAWTDQNGTPQPFYHLDLYRLKSTEEALDIGIEDYLYGPDYCFVEWPGLIEPLLPPDVVRIKITILPDSGRKILLL